MPDMENIIAEAMYSAAHPKQVWARAQKPTRAWFQERAAACAQALLSSGYGKVCLVWSRTPSGTLIGSHLGEIAYSVYRLPSVLVWEARRGIKKPSIHHGNRISEHASEEAAQAACQSDFEKRLSECMEEAPKEGHPIEPGEIQWTADDNGFNPFMDGFDVAQDEEDLPWRHSDIRRGLILFRKSNNAHGYTNYSALSDRIDALPQRARTELANIMVNMAHDFDPEAVANHGVIKKLMEVAPVSDEPSCFDFVDFLYRKQSWSEETFGPVSRRGPRGPLDHLRKEIAEAEENPGDISEFADLIFLATEAACRAGHWPKAMARALEDKLAVNMARDWPDWRAAPADKAIEHVRDEPSTVAPQAAGRDELVETFKAVLAAFEYAVKETGHDPSVGIDCTADFELIERARQALSSSEGAGGWIPIEQAKFEDEWFLVAWKGDEHTPPHRVTIEDFDHDGDVEWWKERGATHFMPLPQAPEEGEA